MKARFGDVILFFILVIKHVTGRYSPHIDTSDLLSQLNLNSKNQNPVIVIWNDGKKLTQSGLTDPGVDDLSAAEDDGLDDDNDLEKEGKEQAKHLMYSYLLRASPDDTNDDVKPALLRALRNRCQAAVKCIQKCPKKTKSYCVPNCKVVFDKLNLCDTPKKKKDTCGCGEENSNENECGCDKRGRTMPPKWLLF